MIENWNELNFWHSPHYRQLISSLVCGPDEYLPDYRFVTRAYDMTAFDDVKAVILGQDPYHTPGVADGLAFSTWPNNPKIPPSLRNIFKEYQDDLRLPLPRTGDLSSWAEQGVLLINTCLTVAPGKAGSHSGRGWEKLTVEVVSRLSERGKCVFILWGKHAGEYRGLVNENTNAVISSSHPSPLSARTGFFGSRPFSTCNLSLVRMGVEPIDWKLR